MTFKVEAYNPNPYGGQHVGVSSGVKITHEETGIFAVVNTERSQHRNRKIAQAMVEYGLAEMNWKGGSNDQQ